MAIKVSLLNFVISVEPPFNDGPFRNKKQKRNFDKKIQRQTMKHTKEKKKNRFAGKSIYPSYHGAKIFYSRGHEMNTHE